MPVVAVNNPDGQALIAAARAGVVLTGHGQRVAFLAACDDQGGGAAAHHPGVAPTCALTIGNFDGVHRGHQQVLATLTATARQSGSRAVAVTFDPHPAQVHRPDTAPDLIMGIEDRLAAISAHGVDAILVLHYTLEFAQQSAEEFVRGFVQKGGQ